jgi:phosphomannomutase
LEDVARMSGVDIFMSKVGEINVARKMAEVGAKIGGEGNGGIMVSDIHTCRDSFSGMALLLEYIAWSGKKVSEIRAELPDYFMMKHKVKASYKDWRKTLSRLTHKYGSGKIQDLDGLRVDYPDFWFHVRPSNTEPVIRVQVEAKNGELAKEEFKKIMEVI